MLQRHLIHGPDPVRERGLGNGVEAVAVDDGFAFETHLGVIELDFDGETACRGRDLDDGDQ